MLNTITTGAMIRLGKIYGNLMVDLRAWNDKLVDRSQRILMETTTLGRDESRAVLDAAGGSVKTAIVMARRGVGREEAERLLAGARRPAPQHRGRPAAGAHVMTERPTLAVGLMSGTSLDGMDAALVRLHGPTRAELIDFVTRPYTDDERAAATTRARPGGDAPSLARLHVRLAEWAAEAVETVLVQARVPASELALIAFHGQTIWHEPPTVTWQLGEPAVLAERFGVRVVSNFRARDLAAGGQGAPLVPMADVLLFASPDAPRVLLNLGGMANLTYVAAAGAGGRRAGVRHGARRGDRRRGGAAGRSPALVRPRWADRRAGPAGRERAGRPAGRSVLRRAAARRAPGASASATPTPRRSTRGCRAPTVSPPPSS